MRKLVIERKRWIRGDDGGKSALYRNSDRKMCCLGFYLRACGVPVKVISGKETPYDVSSHVPSEAGWLLENNRAIPDHPVDSTDCCDLMSDNDSDTDREWTEADRERDIRERFAEHGVKVTFK